MISGSCWDAERPRVRKALDLVFYPRTAGEAGVHSQKIREPS